MAFYRKDKIATNPPMQLYPEKLGVENFSDAAFKWGYTHSAILEWG